MFQNAGQNTNWLVDAPNSLKITSRFVLLAPVAGYLYNLRGQVSCSESWQVD